MILLGNCCKLSCSTEITLTIQSFMILLCNVFLFEGVVHHTLIDGGGLLGMYHCDLFMCLVTQITGESNL